MEDYNGSPPTVPQGLLIPGAGAMIFLWTGGDFASKDVH